MTKKGLSCVAFAFLAGMVSPSLSMANEYEAELRDLYQERLQSWLENPVLIEAIKRQNAAHQQLSLIHI